VPQYGISIPWWTTYFSSHPLNSGQYRIICTLLVLGNQLTWHPCQTTERNWNRPLCSAVTMPSGSTTVYTVFHFQFNNIISCPTTTCNYLATPVLLSWKPFTVFLCNRVGLAISIHLLFGSLFLDHVKQTTSFP
jgi:hypothetical protein